MSDKRTNIPLRCRGERGSATVTVVAVIVTVWGAGLVGLAIAQSLTLRHQVAAAADLAALAGAEAVLGGPGAACAAAARVATANGATLVDCRISGQIADVLVAVRVEVPGGLGTTVRARSRAGPAGSGPPRQ